MYENAKKFSLYLCVLNKTDPFQGSQEEQNKSK